METSNKKMDSWLLFVVLLLMAIGGTLVYTATAHSEMSLYWQKQVIYYVMGLIAIGILSRVPPKVFYISAYPLYGISLVLLIYVSIFKTGNVERWIPLPGGFKLQPSEIGKLALVLVLARFLAGSKLSLSKPSSLMIPGLLFVVPFLLVLKQPNLSTALVFAAITLSMMYGSGLKAWELFLLISPILSAIFTFDQFIWAAIFTSLITVLIVYRAHLSLFITTILINMASGYCSLLLWNKILKDHQRSRILTFINPMRDPKGEGYQVIQSKVATGSGGIWGKGFGEGSQTNLSFLPEEHTDFIFSVLGEQFGFVGCVIVLSLFFFMVFRILQTCTIIRSRFSNLTVMGISTLFSFHVFINVGMTVGVMPVTGLPLPFLSYGGSYVITCSILIGIILNLKVNGDQI